MKDETPSNHKSLKYIDICGELLLLLLIFYISLNKNP